MGKGTKDKPKKPPPWLEATKARLRGKGAAPKPAALDEPTRLDEPIEGLTALFDEALRMLPGQVSLAQELAELAWGSAMAGNAQEAEPPRLEDAPEVKACYERLVELRRTRFAHDRRAVFLVRVVERAGRWEIRARAVDLG